MTSQASITAPNPYEQNFGKAYSDLLPTLGNTIVDILKFFGCERVYGVGGDFAANLIGALTTGLEVLPSGNEMHAGFTACGQAEIESLGVCLTTYTVGSLPCTSAAALAMSERLPVIFISGAPGESEVADIAIHHTVTSAGSWKTEYNAAIRAFAGLGMRTERLQGARNEGQPNIAGERFFQLVAHAYTHKEPVFIEIPRDLVNAKTQPIRLPESPLLAYPEYQLLDGTAPIADDIWRKLSIAQNPLLYIGEKAKLNKDLKALLLAFSERLNIPFATSWFAKGIFDESHPLCLGAYNGAFSNPDCRRYIETEVDYVLDVASSIHVQDANNAFCSDTHHIERFANKTILKGAANNERDLIEVFQLLLEKPVSPFSYQPIERSPQQWESDDRIDFHNLTDVLNGIQQQDHNRYVYLPEVGNSYFASYSLITRNPQLGRGWITNPWYAAMGTSLPYARACAEKIKATGSNDRTVVITGDGGFHFQANELIHFLKNDLPVTIVLMRNNIFHLGKSGDAPIYHCSDKDFDFLQLVKAYGGEGRVCSTVGDFQEYFLECVTENKGIKLIEVPAIPTEEYQCNEIRLLNLYIKARNGIPEAAEEWQRLVDQQ
ncbi:thiamine pyrophosphate-dependent enzyme [Porticoccaceae bacterium LTM1]|nr:thiamine pyrophosphate-dependent enzyme [Porticoccaceae bacterium LTM1]